MNVQGTIYKVGEVQQISEKFQKREIVIRTGGDYPQLIGCQLTQDKCDMADNIKVGDEIDASINLRGREWTNPDNGQTRIFNTIEIWKLETIGIPKVSDGVKDATVIESQTKTDDGLPF